MHNKLLKTLILSMAIVTLIGCGPSNQEKEFVTEICTEFVAEEFRTSLKYIHVFDIWKKDGKIVVDLGYKELRRSGRSDPYVGRLCVVDMKSGNLTIPSVYNEAQWEK